MTFYSAACFVFIFSIVFKTQESVATLGLHERSGVCGKANRQGQGILTSPYYPAPYPDNTGCSWTISTKHDKIITINFLEFAFESSTNCSFDFLKIYDGETTDSKLLGHFCGSTELPEKLTSSGSKLLVVFHSDVSVSNNGFKLKYTVSNGCNRVFTKESGEILSPNYPGKHPPKTVCLYNITVAKGNTIQLIFEELHLETTDGCKYDHLEVFDGPTQLSPSLGKFCGDMIPSVKQSTRNQLLLRFFADHSLEFSGFRVKYHAKGTTMNDICNRPAYPGNCRADFQRWFYNTASKQCEKFSYGGCRSNGNNFRTRAECARQCKGNTMTDFNECSKLNGGCDQACHNTLGSYFCSCWKGYKIGDDQHTCEDVNECSLGHDMHHCEQKCFNMPGSYYCGCNPGFQLSANRRTCTDINECLFGGGGACQQQCANTPGSFKCSCFLGFEPFPGRPMKCRDINECELDPPHCHKCFNREGSYRCECKSGFILNVNKTACLDINECLINNGGCSQLCINQPGNYICQCKDGFYSQDTGNVTCVDIDECSYNHGNCEYQCSNSIGSFNCSCQEGYQLDDDNLNCTDINECLVNNGGCNHKCINTPSSYICGCHDGYEEIWKNETDVICQDIDECSVGSHQCDTHLRATCVNEIGNYSCICPPGYYSDWYNCIDVNECEDAAINECTQQCSNTPGSFHCECFKGFSINSDNKTCTDIDECISSPCDHVCINGIGSFQCFCEFGYQLDEDNKTCLDINECDYLNGLCQHICINTNGSHKCQCRYGYTSLDEAVACLDIDECIEGTACCDTECINEDGGYKCGCNEGHFLSRDNCTCQDTNECFLDNGGCDHICNNTKGGFGCSCRPGYEIDPTNSSRCLDVNECLQDNGGCSQICNNTQGSYQCHCRPIFKLAPDGKTCDHCPSCESFEELILLVEQLQVEVQSLKNWKAKQFGVENTDCRFKSKTYKDSDNWEDGKCRRCFCEKGQVLCFQDKKCFQPVCPAPNDECPFQPEDTCAFDGECGQRQKCCKQATCRSDKVCVQEKQKNL